MIKVQLEKMTKSVRFLGVDMFERLEVYSIDQINKKYMMLLYRLTLLIRRTWGLKNNSHDPSIVSKKVLDVQRITAIFS